MHDYTFECVYKSGFVGKITLSASNSVMAYEFLYEIVDDFEDIIEVKIVKVS